MNAVYFKQLSESQAQPRKADPAILQAKIQKYLAAGNAITEVPPGVSGATLAPMGIKRATTGAQK